MGYWRMHQSPFASVTDYYRIDDLKKYKFILYSSAGKKSDINLTQLQLRCQPNQSTWRLHWRSHSFSLQASSGFWHSLAYSHIAPISASIVTLPPHLSDISLFLLYRSLPLCWSYLYNAGLSPHHKPLTYIYKVSFTK